MKTITFDETKPHGTIWCDSDIGPDAPEPATAQHTEAAVERMSDLPK